MVLAFMIKGIITKKIASPFMNGFQDTGLSRRKFKCVLGGGRGGVSFVVEVNELQPRPTTEHCSSFLYLYHGLCYVLHVYTKHAFEFKTDRTPFFSLLIRSTEESEPQVILRPI